MSDFFKDRFKLNNESLENVLTELPVFCDEYFLGIESRTTILTRLNYAYDLRVFFDFLIKKARYFNKYQNINEILLKDLNYITQTDLERYLNYLNSYVADGVAHTNDLKAKSRKMSSVRSLFKYFFNKEKLESDVASKITMPKLRDKEIIRLEVDEVVKILDEAESGSGFSGKQKAFHARTNLRDTALLTLFLGTGIRISECVGLNIDDVDFNNNSFVVTRKGGSRVILYFSDEISAALIKYVKRQRNKAKDLDPNEKALFLSLQNRRISVRAVQQLVKKYSQNVTPLKKITPHKLRSTYGTNLYKETNDIYIVADVLGHKDVNTTKKHYAAISEESRRLAASRVKLRDNDEKEKEEE